MYNYIQPNKFVRLSAQARYLLTFQMSSARVHVSDQAVSVIIQHFSQCQQVIPTDLDRECHQCRAHLCKESFRCKQCNDVISTHNQNYV